MYRVLNISHLDLDGISAAAAIRETYPGFDEHVTTKFCHYGNIDRALLMGCNSKLRYDRIILSDICFLSPQKDKDFYESHEQRILIDHELPKAITNYVDDGGQLVLLDHHPRVLETQESYSKYLHKESICETVDHEGKPRAGSELAARYFSANVKKTSANQGYHEGMVRRFCELAGDYDVFRNPLGYGGMLAIGIEMMNDPHQALADVLEVFRQMQVPMLKYRSGLSDENFRAYVKTTVLGRYADMAEKQLEEETRRALDNAIYHSPKLAEIHTEFFSSLVAMKVYEATGGAVIVRHFKDRNKAQKLSLRRSAELDVDLCGVAKQFGGGGHRIAAGGVHVNKAGRGSIEDLVQVLNAEIEAFYKNRS